MKKINKIFLFVFIILLINLILKFFLGDVKWFYIRDFVGWLILVVSSLIGFFIAGYNLKIRFAIRFSFFVICLLLGSISNFSIDSFDAFHDLIFISNTIYIIFYQHFSVNSESIVIQFIIGLFVYFLSNWGLYFLVYKLIGRSNG